MMRLSLMHQVMQTVGADWSCPFAEQIAQPWGFDPGSVYYFRGSANFLCLFRREGQRYFLRFNAASERTLAAVQAEVALLDWLHRNGIKVAAPVPSKNGRLVETVTTELGEFIAVVCAALPGAHPDLSELGEAGFRAWGAALGKLHAAMKGAALQPDGDGALVSSNRPTWRDQLDLARPFINADDQGLQAEWQYLVDWADSLPTGPNDYGLIHYDFELDNLLWQDGEIAILDFDDSVHSWYVADIANALRDLFEDGVDLNHPLFQAFQAGYQLHHPVNPELLSQLPTFLRMHQLCLFGRLSRALDLQPAQQLPDWLQGLNAKLQRRVDAYRNSF